MNDARKQNQPPLNGLNKKWLRHVDQLLALEGDARRHGLVLFSFNLNWFYAHEPAWTERNILSVLEKGNDQDRDAVWSGFFWGARTPSEKLFLRLKSDLLEFAIKGSWLKRGYGNVLPDGHFKFPHLWPVKFPQAGRLNYQSFGLAGSDFLSW